MRKSNENRSKLFGMISSFLNSLISTIIALVFVPYLIKNLGSNDYGVYQITQAFAANLSVLNFGMSTIISRNIVRYRYRNESKKIENTLTLGLIASIVLGALICFCGYVLKVTVLPHLYYDTLSKHNYEMMLKLFDVLIIYISLLVIESYFSGIIIGCERFAANYILRIVAQGIRVALIVVFVNVGLSVVYVAVADVIMIIVHIIADYIYINKIFDFKIKWNYFDKELFGIMTSFAIASSLHSIITQVNVSLDKLVLGYYMMPKDVAIYSVSLQLITAVITITKVFSSVYLPDATKLVTDEVGSMELEKLVLKPSRLQSYATFGTFFAFVLLGKELLRFWVGEEFVVMWIPTIIMLLPLSFAYSTTVADLILDAKLKRLNRTLILLFAAVLNLVITIISVPKYGFLGAAMGTGLSYVIGNILLLNVYYIYEIKINVFNIYFKLIKGIIPSVCITSIVIIFLKSLLGSISLKMFLLLIAIYFVVFTGTYVMFNLSVLDIKEFNKHIEMRKRDNSNE